MIQTDMRNLMPEVHLLSGGAAGAPGVPRPALGLAWSYAPGVRLVLRPPPANGNDAAAAGGPAWCSAPPGRAAAAPSSFTATLAKHPHRRVEVNDPGNCTVEFAVGARGAVDVGPGP